METDLDLLCCERLQAEVPKSGRDHVIFKDCRVLPKMLQQEKCYMPSCDYFTTVQEDVKPYMRKVVTTWMLEVCEELQAEDQVFPLSVNYLDRFLCACSISRKHLQLAASVCILIASKIRQCQSISVETLCYYTDNSVSPEEVTDWELLVLSKLQWDVAAVTSFDFVDHILGRVTWGQESSLLRRHAATLVGVCCTEAEFLPISSSVIATACIVAAARGLKTESSNLALSSICELLETTDPDSVEPVIDKIEAALIAQATASQTSEMPSKPPCPFSSTATPVTKQHDTVDDKPTTPTDVQDIHF